MRRRRGATNPKIVSPDLKEDPGYVVGVKDDFTHVVSLECQRPTCAPFRIPGRGGAAISTGSSWSARRDELLRIATLHPDSLECRRYNPVLHVERRWHVDQRSDHDLLEVFSDSDWAGKKDSRRSTNSGTVFLDIQLIYTFSRTQKSVALSSREAEHFAAASSASDFLLSREAIKLVTCRRCRVLGQQGEAEPPWDGAVSDMPRLLEMMPWDPIQ